jgi:predicted nucleic acid-binding protein
MDRLRATPVDWQLRVAATTLGEVEAGHYMSVSTNPQRRDEFASFIVDEYLHREIQITSSTRISYASIMGGIWRQNPPSRTAETDRHLQHINDVWLVASALEHGLAVLTSDSMACIRQSVGREVVFDCWI